MKGMLKAEFFKFSHSCPLWVILAVLTASCGVSIFTGTYDSAEHALLQISKDSMVLILAGAVYGSMTLTEDFSNGLLRHFIASGYRRTAILGAKLVHYLAGCGVLILLYQVISVALAAMVQGVETSFPAVMGKTLLTVLQALPLYGGIFGLFFFLAVWIQKGAAAVGVSVAVSILLVVWTNKLYPQHSAVLRYSPVIQISAAANGTITGAYVVSVLVSLVALGGFVWGSILKLNHDAL